MDDVFTDDTVQWMLVLKNMAEPFRDAIGEWACQSVLYRLVKLCLTILLRAVASKERVQKKTFHWAVSFSQDMKTLS